LIKAAREITITTWKRRFIPMQPFTYYGSDAFLMPVILKYLYADGSTFVEPFAGTGIVSLTLARYGLFERIIMNDIDKRIYAAHYLLKHLKKEYADALNALFSWIFKKNSVISLEEYKKVKDVIQKMVKRWKSMEFEYIEVLGLYTIFLLTGMITPTSKNPSHYFYKKGDRYYANPRTKYRATTKWWYNISRFYRNIDVRNVDGISLLKEFDRDDVVFYLDPPHLVRGDYLIKWNKRDAYRLALALKNIKEAKILLKIGEHDTIYFDVLDDWHVIKINYLSQISQKKRRFYYYLLKN